MFALIKCVFLFRRECLSRMPGERSWTIDQKHADGPRIWQWGWDQRGEDEILLMETQKERSWTRAFVWNCWSNGMRSELPGLIPKLPLVEAICYSEKSKGLGYSTAFHWRCDLGKLNLSESWFSETWKGIISSRDIIRFKLENVRKAPTRIPDVSLVCSEW